MGFATSIETEMSNFLGVFVNGISSQICSALKYPATIAFTIYILLIGYAVSRGEIQDSMNHLTKKIMSWAFIVGIALGGGAYQSYIVSFALGIQETFVSFFSTGTASTIGQMVDTSADKYMDIASTLMAKAQENSTWGIPDIGLICSSAFIFISLVVLSVIAIGMYCISMIGLSISLSVGPIYVLLAAFPATKKFTESWTGVTLGFAVQNGMIAACLSCFLTISNAFTAKINPSDATQNVFQLTLVQLVITICVGVALWNVKTISSALTGGVGIEGMGSQAASFILNKIAHAQPKPDKGDKGGDGGGSADKGSSRTARAAEWAGRQAGKGAGAVARAAPKVAAAAHRYVKESIQRNW